MHKDGQAFPDFLWHPVSVNAPPEPKTKPAMKTITLLTLAAALAFLPAAHAEDRPDHFKGKPSPTLAVALSNLAESNARLATLLKKKTVEGDDILEVHQLSYTIEVALAKLGEEQTRLAALMEEVHLASEKGDSKTVKTSGAAYLKAAAPLTR